MEQVQNSIDPVSSFLWGWLLIYILLATGLYFSIRTRLVQFRRFGHLWRLVFSSRGGAQGITRTQIADVRLQRVKRIGKRRSTHGSKFGG